MASSVGLAEQILFGLAVCGLDLSGMSGLKNMEGCCKNGNVLFSFSGPVS